MNRAVNVGVVVAVILAHAIDDRVRLLRARTVVEVNERLAVCELGQDREVAPGGGDVERGCRQICHGPMIGRSVGPGIVYREFAAIVAFVPR